MRWAGSCSPASPSTFRRPFETPLSPVAMRSSNRRYDVPLGPAGPQGPPTGMGEEGAWSREVSPSLHAPTFDNRAQSVPAPVLVLLYLSNQAMIALALAAA